MQTTCQVLVHFATQNYDRNIVVSMRYINVSQYKLPSIIDKNYWHVYIGVNIDTVCSDSVITIGDASDIMGPYYKKKP